MAGVTPNTDTGYVALGYWVRNKAQPNLMNEPDDGYFDYFGRYETLEEARADLDGRLLAVDPHGRSVRIYRITLVEVL